MNVVHVENDILILDIELTLRRNKHDQSPEEDEWGFGQVLAVLLVIPLRDFVTSILDIREKVKREKASREELQRTFESRLQQAIVNNTFDRHRVIKSAGNLHVKTLLQLAAYLGNEGLVRYLQEKHVEDKDGEEEYHNPSRH
ncbi:hypothetical protein B0H14DRAFT_2574291 [Mycena olivaceomarginata]|nr:hypothetical protein B0H14DRAFT_2574291 [Mycena olivaceomarginata]